MVGEHETPQTALLVVDDDGGANASDICVMAPELSRHHGLNDADRPNRPYVYMMKTA